MCGRVNVSDNEGVRILLAMLGMDTWPSREPLYNVAPTQPLDVVQWQDKPTAVTMRWGMKPQWAKPGKSVAPLINARSETIHDKPSFRNLIKDQRVIIPISGFYEWHRNGKQKTPFHIQHKQLPGLLLAGIYQELPDAHAEVCIVTRDANKAMSEIHHRMPVIFSPDDAARWIKQSDRQTIDELMHSADNDVLHITEVGDYVNSSRNEGPQCLQPPATAADLFS